MGLPLADGGRGFSDDFSLDAMKARARDLLAKEIEQVIAAERAACAKIAARWGERRDMMTDTAFVPGANHGEKYAAAGIAAAILARGSKDHADGR